MLGHAALAVGACALVAVLGPVDPAPSTRSPRVSLPFELCRGFIVTARGAVGDLDGLRLLLDTGAARTIVDARVARRLDLSGPASPILGFHGAAAAEAIVAPSIRLGPVLKTSVSVLSADLSGHAAILDCAHDVIVGADVMRGVCFTIDYRARTLWFGRSEGWKRGVSFDRTSPYLVIDAIVDAVRLRLLVDTGSEVIAIYERAVPAGWRARVDADVGGTSVTGDVRLRRLTARSIELGRSRWHRRPVFLLEGSGPDPSYDGVLGVRALGLATVHFDLEQMVLSWRTE